MILDTIALGDCLKILPEIPTGTVDMILCDLPYGMTSNKWDSPIPLDILWREYLRVLKETGIVALTASQPFTSTLVLSQPILYRHEWIWIKNRGSNFANTVREPMKEHESVLIFSRRKWTYNKQMQERTGGGLSRVGYDLNWRSKSDNYREFEGREGEQRPELRVPSSWQKFNVEVGYHPTQKPVDLFRYLIRTYTNEGEVVLDNCIGSGTTAVAALREQRHFLGIEQEEKYRDIAVTRVKDEILGRANDN